MGYSGRTDLLERLGGLWDDKGAMLRFSSFLFLRRTSLLYSTPI